MADLTLHYSPWLCTRARHRLSTCTLCADNCPTKAISWAQPLQIDPNTCTGCGVCASVCPTGALETDPPAQAWLPTGPQGAVDVAVACGRCLAQQPGETLVHVPCLAHSDEAMLVDNGVGEHSVSLLTGACTACPSNGGQVAAARMARHANSLRQALGLAENIRLDGRTPPPPPPEPAVSEQAASRRKFFALLGGRAIKASGAADTLGGGDVLTGGADSRPRGELPVRLPARRERLLAALGRLYKQGAAVGEAGAAAGLWAQFSITDACTGCQMCAFFCPTGALQRVERDGKPGLTFRIAYCTNCRLCEEACYKKAVVLSPQVDLRKVLADTVETLWLPTVKPGIQSLLDSIRRFS